MKRIGWCLLAVLSLFPFSARSQNVSGRYTEVDRVGKTVLQAHLNDEFYLQIRCLPDVRFSTDDYILKKVNGKWKAEHRMKTTDPPPWKGTNSTSRKEIEKVLKMEGSNIEAFLKTIDIDRLVKGEKNDSLSLDDSEMVFGIDCYAIMICSKGTFKLYEYPIVFHNEQLRRQKKTQSIYWQSAYLDNLIANFTKSLYLRSR